MPLKFSDPMAVNRNTENYKSNEDTDLILKPQAVEKKRT